VSLEHLGLGNCQPLNQGRRIKNSVGDIELTYAMNNNRRMK
jgi:hypothetical protein